MAQADYLERIKVILFQSSLKEDIPPDNEIYSHLSQAARFHSLQSPYTRVASQRGDGSSVQFSLPTDYIFGQSVIDYIEYPTGSVPPSILDSRSWAVGYYGEEELGSVRDDELVLMLYRNSPSNGEYFRYLYTALHVIDSTTDTVPLNEFEPLCLWTCSKICDAIAMKFSSITDNSNDTDFGGAATENAREMRQNANRFRKGYWEWWTNDDKTTHASSISDRYEVVNDYGLITHGSKPYRSKF